LRAISRQSVLSPQVLDFVVNVVDLLSDLALCFLDLETLVSSLRLRCETLSLLAMRRSNSLGVCM